MKSGDHALRASGLGRLCGQHVSSASCTIFCRASMAASISSVLSGASRTCWSCSFTMAWYVQVFEGEVGSWGSLRCSEVQAGADWEVVMGGGPVQQRLAGYGALL